MPAPPPAPRRLRVLVADDSAASQRAIADLLARDPRVEVVARAGDGEQALQLTLELEPDCVCLDLEMPRMDGFTFLRLLMDRRPTPVLVISSYAGKQDVFRALELGALDFIAKPAPGEGADPEAALGEELARKVAMLRALRLGSPAAGRKAPGAPRPARPGARPAPVAPAPPPAPPAQPPPASGAAQAARRAAGRVRRVVAIGASTGGPTAIMRLFERLSPALPQAYLLALHMPPRFTKAFAERLARRSGFEVAEAATGDELAEGRVLVAPGGFHLSVQPAPAGGPLRVALARAGRGDATPYCPSVDRLLESVAAACGPRACAVVLTGMGSDGQAGVRAVRAAGGLVLAESEGSAVVYGMPREAVATGCVDAELPLDALAERLASLPEVNDP